MCALDKKRQFCTLNISHTALSLPLQTAKVLDKSSQRCIHIVAVDKSRGFRVSRLDKVARETNDIFFCFNSEGLLKKIKINLNLYFIYYFNSYYLENRIQLQHGLSAIFERGQQLH